MSTLQTIVRMAVKKGVLDFYPFLDYSYERPKGEPRSITQEELERIIDLEIARPVKQEKTKRSRTMR